jgi:uncharacterized protein (DUF2147 family)
VKIPRALLVLLLSVGTLPAFAEDLDGFWKIDDQPVWMEIHPDGDSSSGTVRRNDRNPEAVGLTLLQALSTVAGETRTWAGQIFAARLGEYRDAEITLAEPERLEITVKAGFRGRTIGWTRVETIPEAATQEPK